jgi:VWFA-related protein
MSFHKHLKRGLVFAALVLLVPTAATYAQQTNRPESSERTDEVIRINTALVQTEVMVFDRKGRFVADLKPDQFELNLNGTKQPVSFFERVTAGSALEAMQLSAARGSVSDKAELHRTNVAPTERGRMIFFFLDDVHLSPASLARAREALQKFVDDQMNPNDQVAIVSTSGQIGFLQQLTDNPVVLHAAIARLNYKMNPEAYTGKTQISEYMASQVLDYGNRELYAYLLESIKVEQQMGPGSRHGDHGLAASYSAAPYLRNRLRQVNAQGRLTTEDTLGGLESLMQSSAALPGRKVVFFLSDGFIINERKAGQLETLHRVTQAAARAGVIVYTMDLRGPAMSLGSAVDASTNNYADASARRAGMAFGEINAMQEPLKLIADETGGRAIFNSNSIGDGIRQAIAETSDYYLLAWRADSAEPLQGKPRLEVTIKDRPELQVRFRSNYTPATVTPAQSTANNTEKKNVVATSADAELLTARDAAYPKKALPVSLAVGYVNSPATGTLLKASMQIERQFLSSDENGGAKKAEVDVLGVAVDDRGQFSSFKQVLTVVPDPGSQQHAVTWNQQLQLKPGLYQVRVAVRERSSGRMGSAMEWIEIPNTSAGNFALSSLFLGERTERNESAKTAATGAHSITVDVDHRFSRASVLRFQTYVYNASRANASPDVWIQAQVFRNRRQVIGSAPDKVPLTTPDVARLPYWSEIPLDSLPAGKYVLLVSATDKTQNRTSSQRIKFSVE